jgi:serine/threonine protein kinase
MFDMLTGRPPFEAQAASEVLQMQIHKPPPSPREFAPHREITEAAEKVILKAMQKDVRRRYQTMGELRHDLQNAYGTVAYRRHAQGLGPRGKGDRQKRLTEEIADWMANDNSSMSIEQARMIALVEQADKAFAPDSMSPADAESLANALDRALDDDE